MRMAFTGIHVTARLFLFGGPALATTFTVSRFGARGSEPALIFVDNRITELEHLACLGASRPARPNPCAFDAGDGADVPVRRGNSDTELRMTAPLVAGADE